VENKLSTGTLEFDLHGMVGIRLVNATPGDMAAVKRQLGPILGPLSGKPDIVIRFVEQIPRSSRVRYLGLDDVGFTDDAFFVLRGKFLAPVRVQIPFHQIGNHPYEIVCENGLPAVPLLIPILNLTVLSKGALPLHASAFNYNGKGILTTGWSKGGKTEMLLAYAANGAEYVGDEWIYLSGDGQHMYGIPEPIRVWYWHLQQMAYYRAKIGSMKTMKVQALNSLAKLMDRVESGRRLPKSKLVRLTRRLNDLVKRQRHLDVPPQTLFGTGVGTTQGTLDKVFFVASWEGSEVTAQPINPQEVVERMVFSLQEERREFLSYYRRFRFAFPECSNPLIDQAEDIQREILTRILADKEAYSVYHPYPFSLSKLFEVTRPYCA
jgi:hypothetical protein